MKAFLVFLCTPGLEHCMGYGLKEGDDRLSGGLEGKDSWQAG